MKVEGGVERREKRVGEEENDRWRYCGGERGRVDCIHSWCYLPFKQQ